MAARFSSKTRYVADVVLFKNLATGETYPAMRYVDLTPAQLASLDEDAYTASLTVIEAA